MKSGLWSNKLGSLHCSSPLRYTLFQNFVRNSLGVRDDRTLDQLWDAFNTATKPVCVDHSVCNF